MARGIVEQDGREEGRVHNEQFPTPRSQLTPQKASRKHRTIPLDVLDDHAFSLLLLLTPSTPVHTQWSATSRISVTRPVLSQSN